MISKIIKISAHPHPDPENPPKINKITRNLASSHPEKLPSRLPKTLVILLPPPQCRPTKITKITVTFLSMALPNSRHTVAVVVVAVVE